MKDLLREAFRSHNSIFIKEYIKNNNNISRSDIILLYKKYCIDNDIKESSEFIEKIKLKPIRTLSGVVPITVLTKPFP
jgi:histone acetyltransferase (RNA polymerase elongator complex component)